MIDRAVSEGVGLPGSPAGARVLLHPTRYQAIMRQLAAATFTAPVRSAGTAVWPSRTRGPRSWPPGGSR